MFKIQQKGWKFKRHLPGSQKTGAELETEKLSKKEAKSTSVYLSSNICVFKFLRRKQRKRTGKLSKE